MLWNAPDVRGKNGKRTIDKTVIFNEKEKTS